MESYLRSLYIAACGSLDEELYLTSVRERYPTLKREYDKLAAPSLQPEPQIALYSYVSIAEMLIKRMAHGLLQDELLTLKFVVSRMSPQADYSTMEQLVKISLSHDTKRWDAMNPKRDKIMQDVCSQITWFVEREWKKTHPSDSLTPNVFEYIMLGKRNTLVASEYDWSGLTGYLNRLLDEAHPPEEDSEDYLLLFKEVYITESSRTLAEVEALKFRADVEKRIVAGHKQFNSIFKDDVENQLIHGLLEDALSIDGALRMQLPKLVEAVEAEMPRIWGDVMSREYYVDWAFRKQLVEPSLDFTATFDGFRLMGAIPDFSERVGPKLAEVRAGMLLYEQEVNPLMEINKVRVAENNRRAGAYRTWAAEVAELESARNAFEEVVKGEFIAKKQRLFM